MKEFKFILLFLLKMSFVYVDVCLKDSYYNYFFIYMPKPFQYLLIKKNKAML